MDRYRYHCIEQQLFLDNVVHFVLYYIGGENNGT